MGGNSLTYTDLVNTYINNSERSINSLLDRFSIRTEEYANNPYWIVTNNISQDYRTFFYQHNAINMVSRWSGIPFIITPFGPCTGFHLEMVEEGLNKITYHAAECPR